MHDTEIDVPHLKQVSRLKHQVLGKYLPSWAMILGSSVEKLYYIDCFAGPGVYECAKEQVDGSPVIAVKAAKNFAARNSTKKLGVILLEADKQQLARLNTALLPLEPYPENLKVVCRLANSHEVIPGIIDQVDKRNAPAFFLVDPYGHPLSIPVMNRMLKLRRSELLINVMWWRINMDLENDVMSEPLNALFGSDEWSRHSFRGMRGQARERSFMKYFTQSLNAKYILPFRIRYDAAEDRIKGASARTKYYLLHASNSLKAVLLMKEVMWPLGDEEGTYEFSGSSQGKLISGTPDEEQLKTTLLSRFKGQELAYDEIRENTWELPYIDKHYRSVLQKLRKEGQVNVRPVTSKGSGLTKRDIVKFP